MRLFRLSCFTICAAFVLAASTAAGQDVSPKLTIAAAGGIATPFHADFDFTAPGWELSARGSMARHAAVEVFFEQWEHSEGSVQQRTTYRMRTAGFHVLGTGGAGRVSLFGGGGLGLLVYERRSTSTFSSNPFTVQGVAEVDVTIVPRVQVFGRYLLVVPPQDPGFGHATFMAGARIVLW